ncbi:MAG: CRISPR-associated protein Cas4 [Methanothermobacter sp.]|nr:CRISPR-associated protein Cas4 [Methanothermobacter sp.]
MDFSSDGDPWITVGDIVQYYYCPRKVYFLKVLGVPFVTKKKMFFGQQEHEREIKRMKQRKKIFGMKRSLVKKVKHKVYLKSQHLHFHGVIDVVLFLKNEIIPVEIKTTDFLELTRSRKKQIVAYALLVDENFENRVRRGILYFSGHRKSKIVDISYEDKEHLIKDIKAIKVLFKSEKIPRKVNKKKCKYCEVSKYCV